MELTIKQEQKGDCHAVYAVNTEAFGRESEARLVDLLRKDRAFIPELSLIAESNNRIVGHILFTKIDIVDEGGKSHTSLALAPVAVLPGDQQQGIGAMLINTGLTIAKSMGYRSVIVLGHEHYYPKFGFAPASTWSIKPPFDVPDEVFMALELVPDGLNGVSGVVRYAEPFEQV